MCASSPQAQGCAVGEPRRPLANPEHMDVRRARPRGGLSLGDFSLAKQREVTRAHGRRAEKDRDVDPRDKQSHWVPAFAGMTTRLESARARASPIRPSGTFPRKRGKELRERAVAVLVLFA